MEPKVNFVMDVVIARTEMPIYLCLERQKPWKQLLIFPFYFLEIDFIYLLVNGVSNYYYHH